MRPTRFGELNRIFTFPRTSVPRILMWPMSKSDYLKNVLLNHQLGGPDFVRPATVYIALFLSNPTSAGTGTEVSGGSYIRAAVLNNSTNFPVASGGEKSNGTPITFVTPTASWGSITHFAIFDAVSGGNLLRFGALTIPKTINAEDVVNFPIGALRSSES